ncbi:MAG: AAA family ATPase [Chitinophagales bacterium]|nr:AAA family ATPase [Chitinophagales bacterium]
MKINSSIVIIGEICSGKSTLARRLAEDVQLPKASFGGYLLQYCKDNGIPEHERGDLQNMGQQMIEDDAPSFLHKVINFSTTELSIVLFEGVRHEIILREISGMSGRTATIYVEASYSQRLSRYLARQKEIDTGKTEADFLTASRHPVEREVPLLKEKCSFVIESSDSADNDYEQLKQFISKWLSK